MAKWRFGINKTMSILVAETHTKLLAKTHTFSYQFRKGGGKKGKKKRKLSRRGIEPGPYALSMYFVASKLWRGF